MTLLNETHAPHLRSWVDSANLAEADFPLQNLPFAVFRRRGEAVPFRVGVAIGDQILDLAVVAERPPFSGLACEALAAAAQDKLNGLMAMGAPAWRALRLALSRLLREGAQEASMARDWLVAQAEAEYAVPAHIGDYTDFYTSIHHATNIGKLFRPDSPLMPNYKWLPISYHGRSSSIVISESSFVRPHGQTMVAGSSQPSYGPSRRLDFELELGAFIGKGNDGGTPVPMSEAEDHVFGMCLLNDWSARDVQSWEYQPLGPFLSKNFCTTLSPWIVTMEALAPFRVPFSRPPGDPELLPYLDASSNRRHGALSIELSVELQTSRMRKAGMPGIEICRTNYRHAYWTLAQMVTHHTSNGCNLRPGDLLGTGTLSGPALAQAAALIELTQGGSYPVALGGGESRQWVEDGDTVVLRGWCRKNGVRGIGFGSCSGTVHAAVPPDVAPVAS